MIFRGSQALSRLSQLKLLCRENHRIVLLPSNLERVQASYSTLRLHDADSLSKENVITGIARRGFAEGRPVSRPKGHTGRTTTTPRKKAAPTAKPATTPKTTVAKKIAVAKKPPAKKPKAITKAKAKAKPKAKPKPKTRKQPTDLQKAASVAKKERLGIKKLKEMALSPPKQLPVTAWMVMCFEGLKGSKDTTSIFKSGSARYKALSPEELEQLNHTANLNKATNHGEYRRWIESHTPAQIRQANIARVKLRRHETTKKPWRKLTDDRQVKRARSSFSFFFADRLSSGDFRGIKVSASSKLIAKEWRALATTDKKEYEDLAAQDMARYEQEQKAVFNLDVSHKPRTPTTTTTP